MNRTKEELWVRFQKYYSVFPSLGLSLDLSRLNFQHDYFQVMAPRMQKAFDATKDLEDGGIANVRFDLFSRYLQQLVMESLGKAMDLDGRKVCQGIAVYGNEGSTYQYAYNQHLMEVSNDFCAIFILGVEGGKKAAAEVMVLQRRVLSYFREKPGQFLTSNQIASGIGAHGDFETVFQICECLARNQRGISIKVAKSPFSPFEAPFCWS